MTFSSTRVLGDILCFFVFRSGRFRDDPMINPSAPLPDREKAKLELLKLEYEKAAERYENIYKAVWQSFSYLGLLSAAILAFGAQQLTITAAIFLAGTTDALLDSCPIHST